MFNADFNEKEIIIEDGILKQWKSSMDSEIIIPDNVIKIAGDNLHTTSKNYDEYVEFEGPFYAAFMRNTNIRSVIMSDSVEIVGAKAFEHCSNLEYVKFSKNLKKIEIMAFLGCNKLKEIILPEGFKSLACMAITSCSGLQSVTLPASLTDIDPENFEKRSCPDLVIKAPKGSYGIQFAKENGIDYEEM